MLVYVYRNILKAISFFTLSVPYDLCGQTGDMIIQADQFSDSSHLDDESLSTKL